MSLPLPGYVRRRRFCADSRRTGIVRRPGMREECGYLDSTRPRYRFFLDLSALSARYLIDAVRRGPQATGRRDACSIVAYLRLACRRSRVGRREDNDMRACLLPINILFLLPLPDLLSTSLPACLLSTLRVASFRNLSENLKIAPFPAFALSSAMSMTDNAIVLFLSNYKRYDKRGNVPYTTYGNASRI